MQCAGIGHSDIRAVLVRVRPDVDTWRQLKLEVHGASRWYVHAPRSFACVVAQHAFGAQAAMGRGKGPRQPKPARPGGTVRDRPPYKQKGTHMTYRHSIIALALLATHLVPAIASSCGAAEAVLRDIKLKTWPSFYRNQDVKGLAEFLHEDFHVVGADGSVSPRNDELAWVKKSSWNPTGFLYTVNSIVCPAPGVALIVGEGRFKARSKDKAAWIEHRYVSSNVLVAVDGRWRAVSSHISGEQSKELPN